MHWGLKYHELVHPWAIFWRIGERLYQLLFRDLCLRYGRKYLHELSRWLLYGGLQFIQLFLL